MSYDQYTLGLDIGIASVGWCLLGKNHIIDLGVRAFDKAETDKEGDPLNLVRRQARLARHRLAQRAWRLKKLARELKRQGLIDDIKFFQPSHPATVSPWRLRVKALDHRLTREEWARVIYHLCKHRGFHWSRAEEKQAEGDAKGEGGRVKQGLAGTRRLMADKQYRSAAEMLLTEFPGAHDAQRNKQGEYTKALSRELLADEMKLLFANQRRLGNPFAGESLEEAILGKSKSDCKNGLFWAQKPPLPGDVLHDRVGKCTFEESAKRAPKASFTAERHVWLTRLNNLRILCDGETRPLNAQERAVALPLPYQQVGEFTYKQLHSALVKQGLLPESFEFAGLRPAKEGKDPKSQRLIHLPAWQKLRSTLQEKGLKTEWESLAGAACSGHPEVLDGITRVLSIYKEDDEARKALSVTLAASPLPNREDVIEALLDIRFDTFHALSLKALYKIVPHMETGMRYDEACIAAGYHHSQLHADEEKQRLLPPLYAGRNPKDGRMVFSEKDDIPRNPVVLRALNQARKVVNAIIRRHGSPMAVNIEMARGLSRPLDERRKIEREQADYRERNEKDKERFIEHFRQAPKGGEFEKFRLYREQDGKCIYSQAAIDFARLLEPGYVEVDHALPYSRSFDDSKNNKVLALTHENRNKGNRTPYEYLGGAENSTRWQAFVTFVETNKHYRKAKRSRLLRKDFGAKEAEEFRERNLNDTRYICRFFKNYVERYLKLAESSESRRCVVLSGQMTAFLRARWGIHKIRSESDRHHALDAAVVAACTHGMVKRLSDYARSRELSNVERGFVDTTTGEIIDPAMYAQLKQHFPEPWPHFHHELEARLKIDQPERLREEMERLGSYDEAALQTLRPLFVSRAPQRRNGGAAHKDTIYSQPTRLQKKGSATQKIRLSSLSLKNLDSLIDPERNARLYAAIRERLEAHGGKADKAFPPDNPLRKPDRNGQPTGPVVRSVTQVIDKLSGIPVRGGIARNDAMLRVDVFTKAGKFHLIPVYVHHKATGLPNRAIVQGKDEAEWTLIDESFDWCFSLYPNDLVKVTHKGSEVILGYFRGCHSGTGAINVALHDRFTYGKKTTSFNLFSKNPNNKIPKDKLGLIEGIGVKTALNIEKFHVDTLGHIYPAPPEPRRGLA